MRYICNAAFDNNSKDAEGKKVMFTKGDEYTGKKEEIDALLKSGLIVSEDDFKNVIKNDLKGFESLKKQLDDLQKENAELRKRLGFQAHAVATVEPIEEKAIDERSTYEVLRNKTREELNGIAKQMGLEIKVRDSKDQVVEAIMKADEEG